jgi:hypothetical protein
METPTHVTYHFENGAKQICIINEKVLCNVKGRQRSYNELFDIFATTAHDLGAVKFEL